MTLETWGAWKPPCWKLARHGGPPRWLLEDTGSGDQCPHPGSSGIRPGSMRMKKAAGHDISVGGPDLAGQAMVSGLVDEMHVFVTPVTVGGGTPALPAHFHSNFELLGVDPLRGWGRPPSLPHQQLTALPRRRPGRGQLLKGLADPRQPGSDGVEHRFPGSQLGRHVGPPVQAGEAGGQGGGGRGQVVGADGSDPGARRRRPRPACYRPRRGSTPGGSAREPTAADRFDRRPRHGHPDGHFVGHDPEGAVDADPVVAGEQQEHPHRPRYARCWR